MRSVRGIVLVGAVCALTGCGASASEQVQAKLQQFAHAVADRDSGAMCRQVLAPALVQRFAAANLNCDQAMRVYFQSVADPSLSVSKVHVSGGSATAVVVASARGQQADRETVRLVNTKNGWRLASLAAPR